VVRWNGDPGTAFRPGPMMDSTDVYRVLRSALRLPTAR
jgi:hypothetical protein